MFGATSASTAPLATPGLGGVDVAQKYKDKIVAIYQQHNPTKVGEIDTLMAKYKGTENVMYAKICKKYNVPMEPVEAPGAPQAGAAPFGGGSASPFGAMGVSSGATQAGLGAPNLSGATQAGIGAPSLFGAPGGAMQTGFGGAAAAPANPFGATGAAPCPFGGASAAPATPFGMSAQPAAQQANPFAASAPAMGGMLCGGMPGAQAQGAGNAVAEYRSRILAIYQQHNPSKIAEVDNLLVKNQGKEYELYMRICNKYKVPPQPQLGGGAAPQGMFGAAQAANPFAAAPSGATPFGGVPQGFGASSASAFGGSPFGGGASQPAFGTPSALGGTPFGGAAPNPFGGSGAAPMNPFGAAAPSSMFGAPAATTPAFGTPSALGASPFAGGGAASPFGAPGSGGGMSPFGMASGATPFGAAGAGGAFGGSLGAVGGGFGALANQAQQSPFAPSPAGVTPSPFGAGAMFQHRG